MSIDEVEEKFNMGQLVLMGLLQKLSFEESRQQTKRGRVVNRGKTKEERNLNAFKRL